MGECGLLAACNLQGRKKTHVLEEPWAAIFLASHSWQVERLMTGARAVMVSMALSFPHRPSLPSLSQGLGYLGALGSPVLNSSLHFAAKYPRLFHLSCRERLNTSTRVSGTRNSACLLKRGSASQTFSCTLSRSEHIYFVKCLTHTGKCFCNPGHVARTPGWLCSVRSSSGWDPPLLWFLGVLGSCNEQSWDISLGTGNTLSNY